MFHVDYSIVIIQENLGLHKDLSRIPFQWPHTIKQDRGLRGSMVVSPHNEVDSLQSCKVVSLRSETTVIPYVDKFIQITVFCRPNPRVGAIVYWNLGTI